MPYRAALLAVVGTSISQAAHAQVTAVVTETTATVVSNFFNQDYAGTDIADGIAVDQGDYGSFASTSQIEPGFIQFRNGNAAAGNFVSITSRTIVDITFRNDGDTAVTPLLTSTITPEGMGFFVAPLTCRPLLAGCAPGSPDITQGFQNFALPADAPSNILAGSSFLFRITGNGETMFELDGSVALVRDTATQINSIVTDLVDAAAVLSGFRLNSPVGSQTELGYAWDATSIDVPFPAGTLLQPGESATLRYETVTQSIGNTLAPDFAEYLVGYAAFGDPVGRRGGATRTPFAESGLTYDLFRFNFPTYRDGVLSYTLDGFIAPVPEPASWSMMIAGFGVVGGALRRRAPGAKIAY